MVCRGCVPGVKRTGVPPQHPGTPAQTAAPARGRGRPRRYLPRRHLRCAPPPNPHRQPRRNTPKHAQIRPLPPQNMPRRPNRRRNPVQGRTGKARPRKTPRTRHCRGPPRAANSTPAPPPCTRPWKRHGPPVYRSRWWPQPWRTRNNARVGTRAPCRPAPEPERVRVPAHAFGYAHTRLEARQNRHTPATRRKTVITLSCPPVTEQESPPSRLAVHTRWPTPPRRH